MKDISYHMLDIVQNSIHAGASLTEISLMENSTSGTLTLKITDNGSGMTPETLTRVTDPFFTSSVTKKVGLGLPLLKQNAELTGGSVDIESEKGKGTTLVAVFYNRHIDMIPTGDLALTIKTLIALNPDKDFIYRHKKDDREFILDTLEMRHELEDISLNTPEVLDYITEYIQDNLKALLV
jgi:hypothetical protein